MTDTLDATGLSIDDLETRFDSIVAELRGAISTSLDVSTSEPTGQAIYILTERLQAMAELLQELYAAIDPDEGSGHSADAVALITGTQRRDASQGVVVCNCTFSGVTVLPAGTTRASVSGAPDNLWEVVSTHTSAGAGIEPVSFQATETGPIEAPSGTISVIATPIAGWTAVTNPLDATPGLTRETTTALKLRREQEVAGPGSASVIGIKAAVSAVEDVSAVIVYENTSWRAVSPMPPKSIEAVYWDGGLSADTDDIAEAIFEKAGGIEAYGTNLVTYEDSQGEDHIIGMTLADEQEINVKITGVAGDDYIGITAMKEVIVAWALAELSIGDDVYRSQLSALAIEGGLLNVTAVELSIWPAAPAAADITIGAREIATIASGHITVNT